MSSQAPNRGYRVVPYPDWELLRVSNPAYPALLREIPSPPDILLRGELSPFAEMVALVGSRRCTPYGEELAFEVAFDLARVGMTVVSGLARGIDAAAHRGALAGGGRTVAVMGTGPDRVYPAEHRRLAKEIAERGALITQFPAGVKPLAHHFPIRNATISGLALGVVVVEAKRNSGAMLTAGSAGQQGRVVMAVPGSVRNANAAGSHDLIRDGARLVTCAADVVQELRGEPLLQLLDGVPGSRQHGDLRDQLLDLLAGAAYTLDEIAARVEAPAREVASAAAQLRLDGEVALQAGVYSLLRNRHAGVRGS